jgi:hypothetical protein
MNKFHCKTKYVDEPNALLKVDRYQNNDRICLSVYSPTGEALMKCTTNIPEVDLTWDLVAIKNYSENEGILECLIANNFISEPIQEIKNRYTEFPVCQLNLEKIHTEDR